MNPFFTVNISKKITLTFPAYSVFACIGLFCAMLLIYYRINKEKMNFKKYLYLIGFMGAGVVVGSKLLFIITRIPDIVENFSFQHTVYVILTSGFVFYGGLFGAITGVYIYSKLFSIPFKRLSDIVAPAFPLFHMWGRVGCLFAGCCYGVEAPWGIELETNPGVKHIPVQLFESGLLLIIFLIVLLNEKKIKENISLMKFYLIVYALCRFILEFFRGDKIRGIWWGVSTSQWLSLIIFVTILILIVKERVKYGADI